MGPCAVVGRLRRAGCRDGRCSWLRRSCAGERARLLLGPLTPSSGPSKAPPSEAREADRRPKRRSNELKPSSSRDLAQRLDKPGSRPDNPGL